MGSVPERLTWAVRNLDPAPGDRVLEIGCGRGVALALLCERLTSGTVTAIDRSGTAVAAARRRNAESVAAGRAVVRVADLEEAEFPDGSFDRILAVDVNLFWVRSPDQELAALRRWLAPGGTLCLCWEPPAGQRAQEIAGKVEPVVAAHGFATEVRVGVSGKGSALVCVVGRAAGEDDRDAGDTGWRGGRG
ncbi:class I SAM-dependent methyltransferase [Streptomyces bicolor]|uniref:class I SAM-dependent methyltransferase n=1 Tax=Streptomyces bicolor TaxID=66874 RepID=UPI00069191DD|nr:class I SAM-dependent methyltransferase [Streptomyces bicolor]